MNTSMNRSCLIHTRCLVAVLTLTTFAAHPTFAESVNLPTLEFPNIETGWGCSFFGTCSSSAATQSES